MKQTVEVAISVVVAARGLFQEYTTTILRSCSFDCQKRNRREMNEGGRKEGRKMGGGRAKNEGLDGEIRTSQRRKFNLFCARRLVVVVVSDGYRASTPRRRLYRRPLCGLLLLLSVLVFINGPDVLPIAGFFRWQNALNEKNASADRHCYTHVAKRSTRRK